MEFVRRKLRVVLLVDDYPRMLGAWRLDIRHHFSSTLRMLDASDGASALLLAKTEQPDLAIIDQHLGDGLGTDLLPELRRCAPEMLMMLTSCDPTREDARCAGSNVIAVVTKPKSWAPYFCAIEAGEDLRLLADEPATLSLAAYEACHISRVLRAHLNNVTATAQVLGMDRSGLQRKLQKLGITIDRSKPDRRHGDSV